MIRRPGPGVTTNCRGREKPLPWIILTSSPRSRVGALLLFFSLAAPGCALTLDYAPPDDAMIDAGAREASTNDVGPPRDTGVDAPTLDAGDAEADAGIDAPQPDAPQPDAFDPPDIGPVECAASGDCDTAFGPSP